MAKDFKAHRPQVSDKDRRPASPPAGKPVSPEQLEAAWQDKQRQQGSDAGPRPAPAWPKEVGGPSGPEPTRYGDWERNGICSDF